MHEIGTIVLKIGFYTSLITFLSLIFIKQPVRNRGTHPGILMGMIGCLSIFVTTLLLLISLISGNFSIEFVYHNSDQSLPLIYKISALWSGSAGSMLFWTSILAIMLWCIAIKRREEPVLRTLFLSIHVLIIGFMLMITYIHNPFESVTSQTDGFGLNPALQSLGMVVHPPILIIGFCCFFIAFGYGLYDLMHAEEDHMKLIRQWSLWGYTLLTIGIITGGLWAYTELGWGGYWSWDPVENMSLVNWTLATGLIHILRRKRRNRMHHFLMLTATAFSILFGTFITRSGILKSVHAYSGGKVAIILGGFIFAVLLGICIILILYKMKHRQVKGEDKHELKVKATMTPMVIGILLCVLMACTILAGTIYPLISKVIGQDIQETPVVYYEYTFGMMALAMIGLLGASKRLFPYGHMFGLVGGVIGAVLFIGLSVFSRQVDLIPKIAVSLSVMILVNILWHYAQHNEQYRQIRGYASIGLIHMAFLVLAIGVIFSKNMIQGGEKGIDLTETVRIGDYQVNYADLREREERGKTVVTAVLNVQDGDEVVTLQPELAYYHKRGIIHGRAVIRRSLFKDLHVIFRGLEEDYRILLEIKSITLMSGIWLGSFLLAIGLLLRLFYLRNKRHVAIDPQATIRTFSQKEVG